jgi:hypothetical protein
VFESKTTSQVTIPESQCHHRKGQGSAGRKPPADFGFRSRCQRMPTSWSDGSSIVWLASRYCYPLCIFMRQLNVPPGDQIVGHHLSSADHHQWLPDCGQPLPHHRAVHIFLAEGNSTVVDAFGRTILSALTLCTATQFLSQILAVPWSPRDLGRDNLDQAILFDHFKRHSQSKGTLSNVAIALSAVTSLVRLRLRQHQWRSSA